MDDVRMRENKNKKGGCFTGKAASFPTFSHYSHRRTYLCLRHRLRERKKMSEDQQWQLEFEHIDWNDIVEAELEGNTQALEDLKEKSMEMKRSFSCPSPSPVLDSESPLRSTPTQHFKVPHYPSRSKRRTPKQRKPRPHPYQHSEQDYPSLPVAPPHPSLSTSSSPNSLVSYAQATRPGKRGMSERICLSPIDCLPKRYALSGLQSTPSEPGMFSHLGSTPKEFLTDEQMEVCELNENTPGGESHPSKAMVAAQRRLFSPAKENTSPKRSERSASVSELSSHQLGQRQKQIDYGKNTLGYQRYMQTIPKWQRKRSDPMTPDKNKPCSTRAWQGQVKVWRRALHIYDPPNEEGFTQFTSKDAALCGMDTPISLSEA